MKRRSAFDVIMIGGIENYRIKKIYPASRSAFLKKEAWAIEVAILKNGEFLDMVYFDEFDVEFDE